MLQHFVLIHDGLQRHDRLTEDQLGKVFKMMQGYTPGSALTQQSGSFSALADAVKDECCNIVEGGDTEAAARVFSDAALTDKILQARIRPNPQRCLINSQAAASVDGKNTDNSDEAVRTRNTVAEGLMSSTILNRKLLGLEGQCRF